MSIKELQRLLIPRRRTVGTVVGFTPEGVIVATQDGTKECRNATSTSFAKGSKVRLDGDAVVGGLVDESKLPTFVV